MRMARVFLDAPSRRGLRTVVCAWPALDAFIGYCVIAY